jgi:hypothetical protein
MVPEDPKNSHLLALDGAQERLSLYHADVLDYMSLGRAFSTSAYAMVSSMLHPQYRMILSVVYFLLSIRCLSFLFR